MIGLQAFCLIVLLTIVLSCETSLLIFEEQTFVVAWQSWRRGELVGHMKGIIIPIHTTFHNELINYCEGYNASHALVTLGISMLLNHAPSFGRANLFKQMADRVSPSNLPPDDLGPYDIVYIAAEDIKQGDQLLYYYGDDWFNSRREKEITHSTTV
jgi:hypothetical protein